MNETSNLPAASNALEHKNETSNLPAASNALEHKI